MSHIHHIRRLVRILAGFAGALVALGVAAPAAFARVVPQPADPVTAAPAASAPVAPQPAGPVTRFGPFTPISQYHPPATAPSHAAAVGMAGWQIALIAVGAALAAAIVAAIVAVLVDRARSARRLQAATAS